MVTKSARWLATVACIVGSVGCGGAAPLRATAPSAPGEGARCRVAQSQASPLVTEWPASEKANLEARLRGGGVAVAYAGCTMRILPDCRLPGTYAWRRTTTTTDLVEIKDADELYAKLPLGAAALEGELERSGRIAVQTTVAGQLELHNLKPDQVPSAGACADATHLVGALTVGAFKMRSGGALVAHAGGGVAGIAAAGGSTRSEETLMREAGDPDKCKLVTDEAASPDCGSPIQLFLWPLPRQAALEGPAGTVKVRFRSAEPERRWDVLVEGASKCRTPCERWVQPDADLTLRSEDTLVHKNTVQVRGLREHGAEGPFEVEAHSGSMGLLATGATITTFGGMAVVTGVTLLGVGCASDNSGLCKAGAITLPIGVLLLVPGIYMIVKSGAHANIEGPVDTSARTHRAPFDELTF